MKVVFLDRGTLPHPIQRPDWVTEWVDHDTTPQTEKGVLAALAHADICITNKIRLTAGILNRLPQLKLICVAATGYDCIDMQAARERGIPVSNVPGYATQSVAESVIGSIFVLRRQLLQYNQLSRSAWPESAHFCTMGNPIQDVRGTTLGIFGHGDIGAQVATMARALGLEVLLAEHKGRPSLREGYTRFDEVLARSDILSLHCPLSPATTGMIGHGEISRMKPGALLINTARGPLIQEAALVDGLQTGHLGGAAIDVLAQEPPAADNPLLKLEHPNFLLTPHVAWGSTSALSALAQSLHDNLQAFHAGEPINTV